MIDFSRLCLGRADEGQTGRQLHVGEHLLHILLHPNAVLDEHHQRLIVEQWRQQRLQFAIVHRFQAYQHHVALRHVLRIQIGIYIIQMKRTVAGVYLQTVLFHIFIVAVEQEMYLLSCMSQFCSIIFSLFYAAFSFRKSQDSSNMMDKTKIFRVFVFYKR